MRLGKKEGKENSTRNNLNIEEFECGVQLEGSESSKQEWFFTLYNFDGHGRITKEDLSSLLKALYDAVGSSIKLPPHGARTLKLRLSVGQEQAAQMKNTANLKTNPDNPQGKTGLGKGTKEFSKMNNLTRTHIKCINEHKAQLKSVGMNPDPPGVVAAEERVSGGVGVRPPHQPSAPEQLCALEAQEQVEKALSKHLRRQHNEARKDNSKQHKRRHRHSTAVHCPVAPACLVSAKLDRVGIPTFKDKVNQSSGLGEPQAKESQDRRNYYLDLAGVENTCSRFQNNLSSSPLSKSGAVTAALAGVGGGHHRSRSYDVAKCGNCSYGDSKQEASGRDGQACRCDSAHKDGDKLRTKSNKLKFEHHQHLRSKSFDSHAATHRKAMAMSKGLPHQPHSGGGATHANRHPDLQMPPGVLGAGPPPMTLSPHHHRRHRHREKDQEMAMQQVAQWIEREHSWDLSGGDGSAVQRHEHHHIHEHHHHHHYHHYYET
ncbi:protein naked cuticle homolog 1 isoform X2 [Aplysia californica]|nr:protein naked cuticle homolog 1 isoform X2 [Aplysia californica]